MRLKLSLGAVFLLVGGMWQSRAQDCYPVSSNQITAHDFAEAIPSFSSLPADQVIGFAPAPGVRRTFLPSELQRVAKAHELKPQLYNAVCFAWPMHPLSQAEIIVAMKRSLPADAEITIIDQLRAPVPAGRLEFPPESLLRGSDKGSTWTGFIEYTPGHRFSTWVRVMVSVHEMHIVAATEIREGELIRPDLLKTEDYRGPLLRFHAVKSAPEAVGKLARIPIHQGEILTPDLLTEPPDIEKDQLVTVYASCGAAHLETQGIAAERGYRGDTIRIRNAKTKKVFRAVVNGPGTATVIPGAVIGLVVDEERKS